MQNKLTSASYDHMPNSPWSLKIGSTKGTNGMRSVAESGA